MQDGSAGGWPVLFLDVDGVLIPHPDGDAWGETLAPACVARVVRVLVATRARVVLSSLWRHSRAKRELVENAGIPIFSVTPVIGGEPRATEIAAWLRQFGTEGVTFSDYAILDDNEDAAIAGHFIRVDPRHGITDALADAVIVRFGGQQMTTEEETK